MSTKVRSVVDAEHHGQLSLLPDKKVISKAPSLDHIPLLKNHRAALEYACQLADVEPKEVCGLMVSAGAKYDKTKWSRILSGQRTLPSSDVTKFNRVIGNNAYLLYLNHLDGIDLLSIRKTGDDKDRRIAELEQAVADRDRALSLVLDAQRNR